MVAVQCKEAWDRSLILRSFTGLPIAVGGSASEAHYRDQNASYVNFRLE